MFKILIVDDTRSVHAFVKSLLAKSNEITTTSVFNGAEAVAFLSQDRSFDLILLDWEMPVLNGPDAFQAIRAMGVLIPTMMMTTKNNPADIQMMLNRGVSEYLMKPFSIDILFEKIEFVVGRSFVYAA